MSNAEKRPTGHGPEGCDENGSAAVPRPRDQLRIDLDMRPSSRPAAAHRRQLKGCNSCWCATRTQLGGALHSASSGLSDVGADRQFAGMAFDEMRRPGTKRAQHGRIENVSRPFHALREPRQHTWFGPLHNRPCSPSKDGTYLMRLPSGVGGARASTAATLLKLPRASYLNSCNSSNSLNYFLLRLYW